MQFKTEKVKPSKSKKKSTISLRERKASLKNKKFFEQSYQINSKSGKPFTSQMKSIKLKNKFKIMKPGSKSAGEIK